MNDLAEARRILDSENLAFVIVRDGRILARGTGDGVRELLTSLDQLGAEARGASLADKVVGKAVACLAAHAGIVAVDARLASESAVQHLQARGIPMRVAATVPHILNRRGDGLCPLEQLTQQIAEPAIAVAKLREFIAARAAGIPLPKSP